VPDARTKAARDKEARDLEARAAMPPPPSVPAARAASAAAAPPAHRWVRSASTTRGNRVHPGSQRATAAAGALAAVDDSLAKSIRDIIRQKSREERAAENRAKLAKRRLSEDPQRPSSGPNLDGGEGTDGLSPVGGAARDGDDSRALALVGSPGGSGEKNTRSENVSATLALPAPGGAGAVSMTPQVLVVDGQIVINEKSLTVNAAVERATALSDFTRVEESGTKLNSATYANYTKAEKWTKEDTEFFFQALRQFGTDFSLIQRLFPGRSRRQIKKKYLVEDKINPGRVEAAIRNLNPDVALYKNLIEVLKAPEGAGAGGAGQSVAKTVLTRPGDAGETDPALPAPPEASPANAAKGEPTPEAREEATPARGDPESKAGKRRRVAPAPAPAPARASSRRR
jgi:transcription factor TFIIIB component B''